MHLRKNLKAGEWSTIYNFVSTRRLTEFDCYFYGVLIVNLLHLCSASSSSTSAYRDLIRTAAVPICQMGVAVLQLISLSLRLMLPWSRVTLSGCSHVHGFPPFLPKHTAFRYLSDLLLDISPVDSLEPPHSIPKEVSTVMLLSAPPPTSTGDSKYNMSTATR